jgi:TRAP-type transport system small permease protein
MMLLTTADVVMRYFFNKPITGSFELTQYLMALIVSFTIAYSAANEGMVKVSLVTERLSPKTQSILGIITGIPGIGLFIFITWRTFTFVGIQNAQHIVSPILSIPQAPFAAVVACGLVCMILILIVEWLHNIAKVVAI